jgi:hypothetical protein
MFILNVIIYNLLALKRVAFDLDPYYLAWLLELITENT